MATKSPTPLGREIEKQGRSQTWLANETGIERSHLNRIVWGLLADEEERAAIAEALGKTVAELFPETAGAAA